MSNLANTDAGNLMHLLTLSAIFRHMLINKNHYPAEKWYTAQDLCPNPANTMFLESCRDALHFASEMDIFFERRHCDEPRFYMRPVDPYFDTILNETAHANTA